jgi:DNA-binding FadR family transcriptional regulator
MPAAELHKETETERIERWRADMLERAGFSADAAAELAARQDIDLHQAIGLIENGCPPAVALQILL